MYNPIGSAPAKRPASGDEQRTYLAGERTLLAWIRTSLALMGFGFLVAKFGLFLREIVALRPGQSTEASVPDTGWSLWIGVALVLLGLLVNIYAAQEHVRFVRQFAGTDLATPRHYGAQLVILLMLTILGAVMTAYLIVVNA